MNLKPNTQQGFSSCSAVSVQREGRWASVFAVFTKQLK